MISHAPRVKLLTPTTSRTRNVVSVPLAVMTIPVCHPGSRRRHQRTSMPAWLSVNARKTPRV